MYSGAMPFDTPLFSYAFEIKLFVIRFSKNGILRVEDRIGGDAPNEETVEAEIADEFLGLGSSLQSSSPIGFRCPRPAENAQDGGLGGSWLLQ